MTLPLLLIPAAPAATFVVLLLWWLLGDTPSERTISRLSTLTSAIGCAASAWLGWTLFQTGAASLHTPELDWVSIGRYHFELQLLVDRVSWPLVMLTSILVALIGVFSVRYVHRERGFFRFFLALNLFAAGAQLVLTAASFDLLCAGWEMVGLTSVLLVAFFHEREQPVRNALQVFAFYRTADLGLLAAILMLHHVFDSTVIATVMSGEHAVPAWVTLSLALLLLLAACGTSAHGPFSAWLPRAMEGPTPSSAIFYGAISVHLGAYVLLRIEPILQAAPLAAWSTILVGAGTAIVATLVHRATSDAKSSIAYSGMTQLGLIFVEVGAGWPRLALAHIVGHAIVRAVQFLRAPSMLHDFHRVHAAAGGHLPETGTHFDRLVPAWLQQRLYRAGLERGYADAFVDLALVAPLTRLSRWLESLEARRNGRVNA